MPLDERDTAWMWLALLERVVGQLDGNPVGISIQKKNLVTVCLFTIRNITLFEMEMDAYEAKYKRLAELRKCLKSPQAGPLANSYHDICN